MAAASAFNGNSTLQSDIGRCFIHPRRKTFKSSITISVKRTTKASSDNESIHTVTATSATNGTGRVAPTQIPKQSRFRSANPVNGRSPVEKPPTPANPGRKALTKFDPKKPVNSESESKGEEVEMVEKSMFLDLRKRLNSKLSEANSYNRHLKRELQEREEEMKATMARLAKLEDDLKEIAILSRELSLAPAKAATAKVRGKYVLSYVANQLEEIHKAVKEQVADVASVAVREVPLEWFGMAEDVKVMGSFDSWTQGEQLSAEVTGAYNRFSVVLKLRPGSYEIKFLVDGEWRVMPQWPQVGSGLTANNLLVVE